MYVCLLVRSCIRMFVCMYVCLQWLTHLRHLIPHALLLIPFRQGGDDSMNATVTVADSASEYSTSEGGHRSVDTAEDDPPQDGGLDQIEAVVGAAAAASKPGSVCPTLPSVQVGDPPLLQVLLNHELTYMSTYTHTHMHTDGVQFTQPEQHKL
ncbi:hypothetical protein Cgig2_025040 [Carnegiea gigantea]|uniref:Uncharacterized protein n=1 Tax=Carnegiea gigantea TaxID=171969 RepID=A0A9Q1K0N8_9CARY|nr:hypothetical protein Cgig2_025040 [Carnegiea gigantea]